MFYLPFDSIEVESFLYDCTLAKVTHYCLPFSVDMIIIT